MIVERRFHRQGGKEYWIQKYDDWGGPHTDPLEWTATMLGTRLRVLRWLPDTSDHRLLERLQTEYKAACDDARRGGCYNRDARQAQKRLALAILALAAEP